MLLRLAQKCSSVARLGGSYRLFDYASQKSIATECDNIFRFNRNANNAHIIFEM